MDSGILRHLPPLLSRTRLREEHHSMRGLTNHHLSCCVNTLLQAFSATWELLDLLQKWEAAAVRSEPDCTRNVPLQLKKVLTAMRGDLSQPNAHRDFLHCLDRNSIRLNTQHDADELFLAIVNLTQEQMNDKALASEIQNLYKISVEAHLECLQCGGVQTNRSYMLRLPLHIKEEQNTLEDCLTSFFEHQELSGIDCCFRARCESRTPSKQGLKLLSLPPILCMHLKRFRNVCGFPRKLRCRVAFPELLDLSPTLSEAFSTEFAETDCKYRLYAVVVHSGSATCGHYTAYVRDRANMCWYHADDSSVHQASWTDVQKTYGEHHSGTAYILMYKRVFGDEGRNVASD